MVSVSELSAENESDLRYVRYKFDADQKWKEYLQNIEIPPGKDFEQKLEKVRQKYYKNNIDPSFVLKPLKVETSSNGTVPNRAAGSTSSATFADSHSARTGSEAESSAEGSARNSTFMHRAQSLASLPNLYFVLNVTIVLCFFLYLLPLFNRLTSYKLYRAVIQCALLLYSTSLVLRFGLPRLSDLKKVLDAEAMRVFMSDFNAQYLIVCAMLLNAIPSSLLIAPMAIYALFHVCASLRDRFERARPTLFRRYLQWVPALLSKQTEALRIVARLELANMFFLVFSLFGGGRSLFVAIVYFQFLVLRFATSAYSRAVLIGFGHSCDAAMNHPRMPQLLRSVYSPLRSFMRSKFMPTVGPAPPHRS